jgi:hypothetical protein
MLTKSTHFITSLDYFGQNVELYFNKEKDMKTFFGGIISLVMYMTCLAFIIDLGITLVFKQNPSTTISTQTQTESPLIDVYKEDMIFAFYVLGADYQTINDPSIATFTVVQHILNRTDSSNIINKNVPIALKNCTEYKDFYVQRGFEKDFSANGLNNAFCLDRNMTNIVGGNFIDTYYSTILITLTKCVNGTGVTCKSYDEITKRLKHAYFEFYYLDWNSDANNYETPFNRYFSNYFLLLDPTAWKMSQIYFKPAVMSSNIGLIFDSFENKTKMVYDYFREQIDTASTDKGILQVYLGISQNISIYTRIYMKFQDFIANIGGLIQACITIGYIFTSYLTNYQMNEYMMNCLFSFKVKDNLDVSIKQINKDIDNNKDLFKNYYTIQVRKRRTTAELVGINNFMNGSQQNDSSRTPNYLKEEDEINKQLELKINELNSTMSSNFNLSFKNKIYKLLNEFGCKFKRKAIRYYDVANEKLHSYRNYLKIIKLLKEFRQLKKILLNENQYKLFKYHNKQVINIDNNEVTGETAGEEKQKEIKHYELYNVFLKSKEKSNDNKIYKRLLENFDENLAFIFEKINEQNVSSPENKPKQ